MVDIVDHLRQDSTYGSLGQYLYGHKADQVIENLNEGHGTLQVKGVPVTILRKDRNPKDLPWKVLDIRLVVDTTWKVPGPT
jgi:glyceraldehyde 3-phosphate dehydrogenase